MSLEIIRNPAKSIEHAKKKKDINETISILAVNSFVIAFSLVFAVFMPIAAFATPLMILSLAVTVFFTLILASIVFGWSLQVTANTLGGRGDYYGGFTAFTYSMSAPSLGILAASILTVIPNAWPLSFIVLMPSFGLGIATLYRGVKEMFRLDMICSAVTVFITILSLVLTVYFLVVLNHLGGA